MSQVITLGPQGIVMESTPIEPAAAVGNLEMIENTCEESCKVLNVIGGNYEKYASFCSDTLCKVPVNECEDECKGAVKEDAEIKAETCTSVCTLIESVNQVEDSINVAFDFLDNLDIRDENNHKIDFSDPDEMSVEKIGQYLEQILEKLFATEGFETVIGDIFGLSEDNMNKIKENIEDKEKVQDIKYCMSTCHHFDTAEQWIQCGNQCSNSLGQQSIGLDEEEKQNRDGNSAPAASGLVSGVVVVASAVVAVLF